MKSVAFMSLRVPKEVHAALVAVAKYHRRSQANTVAVLLTEEYQRLVDAGKIKESRDTQEPEGT